MIAKEGPHSQLPVAQIAFSSMVQALYTAKTLNI